jgi:hypothetical protein
MEKLTINGVCIPYVLMVGGGVVKTFEQVIRYAKTDVIPDWGSITTDEKSGNGGRDYFAQYSEAGQLLAEYNSIALTKPPPAGSRWWFSFQSN